MSQAADPIGAAPETHSVKFLRLMFGACAAPVFWIGQVLLGYGVSAFVCFPGDHPVLPSATGPLSHALMAFDAIALLAAALGGWVSWRAWRGAGQQTSHRDVLHTGEGRDRFLAVWGLLSSVWFLFAILFNTIASLVVPPCLN
jgi:hypothetical protein